jgi:hypothetical protein
MVLEVLERKGILRIDISENEVKRKGAGTNGPVHVKHEEANKKWREC